MTMLVDVVASAILLTSSLFVLLAAIGLHRFDDVFARIHAATKSVTFGFVLAALGGALLMNNATDVVKLLLAAGFQLISAPVGAHILSRAAYHAGGELSPDTAIDELASSPINYSE